MLTVLLDSWHNHDGNKTNQQQKLLLLPHWKPLGASNAEIRYSIWSGSRRGQRREKANAVVLAPGSFTRRAKRVSPALQGLFLCVALESDLKHQRLSSSTTYQTSAAGRSCKTSKMRARVEGVVWAGSDSGGKKPCAMISLFGSGGLCWKDRTT
jgi:hypothetical protein